MSWAKGQDRIDGLVRAGFLQRVPASKRQALVLIADARRHLVSADHRGNRPAGRLLPRL